MAWIARAVRFGHRFYLWLVLLPFLLGALAYWLIVAVDPYDLRAGGLPPRLASDHRYPDREWPLLIGAALRTPHDMVLLGGSTTMAVSADMLRQAFPDMKSPINLSYIAPRPLDVAMVLDHVAQTAGLKRVILVMDFTLLERRPLRSAAGDSMANMATSNWSHGGDFSPQTALASLHRLLGGTYDLPEWSHLAAPEFMDGARPVTASPGTMQRFRLAVERHRKDVFAKSTLSCGQIPFIETVLVPFLRRMAQQHVTVDLVFPAIPYIQYYDWIDNQPRFNILLEGPLFDQFIVYKQCVVAARERLGGGDVSVLALDTNDAVSGDLRRYLDSAHLIDPQAYRTVLQMIAAGHQALTSKNIAGHEAELRRKVQRAGEALTASR